MSSLVEIYVSWNKSMKKLVYPAEFVKQDDGSYLVFFVDIPQCMTEGKDLPNALYMAEDCLKTWAQAMVDDGFLLPEATSGENAKPTNGGFISLVTTELKDAKPVIKSVSLPHWMAEEAAKAHLSLSGVLQEALTQKLSVR